MFRSIHSNRRLAYQAPVNFLSSTGCTSNFSTVSSPSIVLLTAPTTYLPQYKQKAFYSSDPSLPELTKDRYGVKRGDYSQLNDDHIKYFTQLLGETRVLTDEDEVQSYNVDWIKNCRGYSKLVLKVRTTEEVSKILEFCNKERLAVCPQGGNTGLVGGSVPVHDEIVISTTLMNNIISFDENSGILVCQAGCILEVLDSYLNEKGFMMPIDLGAKGSCNIGGNVSTNAGGLRLLRYGNLHGTVLGVEAVLANGEIVDCLSTLKKDNTGYHLKHLFIGSEGTLGLVTKVAINCPIKPRAINVAFLSLNSFEDILKTFKQAKQDLGEILSSCEMMDQQSLAVVEENLKLRNPLNESSPFYMLIETSGSNMNHDEEKLNKFIETALEKGNITNGIVTNEPGKVHTIWQLRERITDGILKDGYTLKYDVTLPLEHFYSIVPDVTKRLGSLAIRVIGYGHIGDGNLHLNISTKQYSHEVMELVEPYVFEYVSKLKGSVSSEHGIGFKKAHVIHYSKSRSALLLMKQLKNLMDPNKILNPYKVLPDEIK
ncbi:D-2-hydroxyglutarate dehydrogenase, mitochondrial isoform X3 [Chrysoperla carnea]|nr:D-2-hydroxyglutarate dehydrogenase, mitochondrial isoform X3 [Chrysoperla carnea]